MKYSGIVPAGHQRGFGERKAEDTAGGLGLMAAASVPLIGGWLGNWGDLLFGALWALGAAIGFLGGHGFTGVFFYSAGGTLLAVAAIVIAVLGMTSCTDRIQSRKAFKEGAQLVSARYEPTLATGCAAGAKLPTPASVKSAATSKPPTAGNFAATSSLSAAQDGTPLLSVTLGPMDDVRNIPRKKIPPGSVLVYEGSCSQTVKQKIDWKLVRLNEVAADQLPSTIRGYLD